MASTHPRRTTKTTLSAMTPPSLMVMTNMSLRKGATFHSPSSSSSTSSSSEANDFTPPCQPRRSQSTLDDVVDARQRRLALTLESIDRSLAGVDTVELLSSFPDHSMPVPQGFLDTNTMTSEPEYNMGGRSLRPRRRRVNLHASDSGLGSSLQESGCSAKVVSAVSATTRAASTTQTLPRISTRGFNKIHEHVLRPLLAKPSLKPFRPLIEDCPRKINNKEIICLRDLEKHLLFMAPEFTKTAKLYLDFCITSIQCIQATVEFLNEKEQTRISDRPYTNGYFVDLVDQIQQYANQVKASKAKVAKGEVLDDMDAESSDEVKLYGGVTKTGRPAELVRVKKNGKAVSLSTGQPIIMESIEDDETGSVAMKRSLSEQEADDEAIMRSMARRKRSASATELAPKRCSQPGCNKEFKRACDLTKHEKTHSRPWKCHEPVCKYHEYGWPTEKELDRHVNDKHSSSPVLYKCQFAPCPYQSKRESNCKQHMEKSHNWTYVRSKNNGKNRDKPTGSSALPTPQLTNMQTPDSSINDQHTPEDDGGEDYTMDYVGFDSTVYQDDHQFSAYSNDSMLFNPIASIPLQISPAETSNHTSPYSADENFGLDDVSLNFGNNFEQGSDFMLFGPGQDEDLYSARVELPVQPFPTQLLTPVMDIFQRHDQYDAVMTEQIPHISPIGHGNTMLFTPPTILDDILDQYPSTANLDFELFAQNTHFGISTPDRSDLFGEIPSAALDFSQAGTQEFLKNFYLPTTNSGFDEGFSQSYL